MFARTNANEHTHTVLEDKNHVYIQNIYEEMEMSVWFNLGSLSFIWHQAFRAAMNS